MINFTEIKEMKRYWLNHDTFARSLLKDEE